MTEEPVPFVMVLSFTSKVDPFKPVSRRSPSEVSKVKANPNLNNMRAPDARLKRHISLPDSVRWKVYGFRLTEASCYKAAP